jgi:hypothetical protein
MGPVVAVGSLSVASVIVAGSLVLVDIVVVGSVVPVVRVGPTLVSDVGSSVSLSVPVDVTGSPLQASRRPRRARWVGLRSQ